MRTPAGTLPVAECFGPVWQGEGPYAGQRCSFLRLGGCNLTCGWCDTPYTWDASRYDLPTENPPTTPASILDRLASHRTSSLVLTGGEPLIHAHSSALADVLDGWPHPIDLETNGTLLPPAWADRLRSIAISPKLTTGDHPSRRLRPDVLHAWRHHPGAFLKVVCSTPGDVALIPGIAHGWDSCRIWVMPEGTTPDEVLATARTLAQATASHGYNLTLRHHVLIHGDTRGT